MNRRAKKGYQTSKEEKLCTRVVNPHNSPHALASVISSTSPAHSPADAGAETPHLSSPSLGLPEPSTGEMEYILPPDWTRVGSQTLERLALRPRASSSEGVPNAAGL